MAGVLSPQEVGPRWFCPQLRTRPVCAQECDLQGHAGAACKHCWLVGDQLCVLAVAGSWGSPPSPAVVPELPAGGSGDLSRQPDGFWSVGHGAWAGFHFSQVGFCLHTLPVLIFLQIKPVCSVAGGGEGLSCGALVTVIENVWIASNSPPFCGSCFSAAVLGMVPSWPSCSQGTFASRIKPAQTETRGVLCLEGGISVLRC